MWGFTVIVFACTVGSRRRAVDCRCNTMAVKSKDCAFIHLSTNKKHFGKMLKNSQEIYSQVNASINEIQLVIYD